MESGKYWTRFYATSLSLLLTVFFVGIWPINWAIALHEPDHRFTVSGRVCGADGQGLQGVKVIAKDTKASIGGSGITDGDGFYEAKLHLHNENQGDPLLVKAMDFEANTKVEFDPNDVESERGLTVNLGGPCSPETGLGLEWFLGIGLLVIVGLIGLKIAHQKKKKSVRQGKRGGKHIKPR